MADRDSYEAVCDPARRELPGRTYEDDDVRLASNFECGNGYRFRRQGPGRYAMQCEPEPGSHIFSGKGYYFCVAVGNQHDKPQRVTLELASPNQEDYAWRTQHVIVKRGGQWSHLPAEQILTPVDEQTIVFELDLPGRAEPEPLLFVSNYHWHAYTEMTDYLQGLASSRPDVRLTRIGTSAQGRDLWAVEVGPEADDAPTIGCAQTSQPSEMGHFACRAILDFVLSDDPKAAEIRTRHRVGLVPHTNPDGTVLGYGVSDALGRFPYFEADKAIAGDPEATVEVEALWRYLQDKRPWLFIEWHSNHWAYRPGHMLLRYDWNLAQDDDTRRANAHSGGYGQLGRGLFRQVF